MQRKNASSVSRLSSVEISSAVTSSGFSAVLTAERSTGKRLQCPNGPIIKETAYRTIDRTLRTAELQDSNTSDSEILFVELVLVTRSSVIVLSITGNSFIGRTSGYRSSAATSSGKTNG